MINKALEDYSREDLIEILDANVDAIIMVDTTLNRYRAVVRRNFFEDFIDETGDYHELIEKLWFHLGDSNEEITDDYKAFVSYYGKYKGKYSRRLRLFSEGSDVPHYIQMNVYPLKDTDKYIYAMDELGDSEYLEENMTDRKLNTMQNTYLFSMFVDLIKDTTSSISVTEVSDEIVNSDITYSQWRSMTVHMISEEEQAHFLGLTDPEFLKQYLKRGQTTSMDCKMKNLEGVYIWVKLIFSRAQTKSEDEFRFVFMVQDINDSYKDLMSALKKYEELAQKDSLTGLLNRRSMETEIRNSIDVYKKGGNQVSLIMLDLDHFKGVNDTYGHVVGDKALKAFAGILQDSVEGKNATVGRWGGEEFVIDLTGIPREYVYAFSENLRKKVEDYTFEGAGHLTCSIGISHLNSEDSFEAVFNRMDDAMYSSKESGRNRVTEL
jgi:diguanylate cyclase (GGDEF)-like protein